MPTDTDTTTDTLTFDINHDETGYFWNAYAPDGDAVATSTASYETRAGAERALDRFTAAIETARVTRQREDRSRGRLYRLEAIASRTPPADSPVAPRPGGEP